MTPLCPLCHHSAPCENNPCGLRNSGEIRPGDWEFKLLGYSSRQTATVPGRMSFSVLETKG